VSAGRDKVVSIWDLRRFSLVKTIAVFEELEAMLVLPDTLLGVEPSTSSAQTLVLLLNDNDNDDDNDDDDDDDGENDEELCLLHGA
jgi:hypothetical protein